MERVSPEYFKDPLNKLGTQHENVDRSIRNYVK